MFMILTLLYVLYANVGPVRPDGYPRTFMRPVQAGGDDNMLHVIEANLSKITQDVPTLQIDWITMIMQLGFRRPGYTFSEGWLGSYYITGRL